MKAMTLLNKHNKIVKRKVQVEEKKGSIGAYAKLCLLIAYIFMNLNGWLSYDSMYMYVVKLAYGVC